MLRTIYRYSLDMSVAKKVVFVGMSGGVDSSVSAYLLKQQGYTVVGVFIKVWHPDFLECHWEQERLDAMRVAAHLEIPFLTCDAEDAYKKDVADYFIAEYKAGRTPNPDVMCNTFVKFGRFYEFARERGADYIATGHYARVVKDEDRSVLLRGIDTEKDQSYFLWNIAEEALSHTLFPIGHLTKKEVRVIAEKAGLPTATKDESQGVCFLGHIDIPEFLSHFIELHEGEVRTEEGVVIGSHRGSELLTIGQRHGFTVDSARTSNNSETAPYYVIEKDVATNTITVSHKKPEIHKEGSRLILSSARCDEGVIDTPIHVQTRYRQIPIPARIERISNSLVEISLSGIAEYPAVGQFCVIYAGDRVCGGGIIEDIRV